MRKLLIRRRKIKDKASISLLALPEFWAFPYRADYVVVISYLEPIQASSTIIVDSQLLDYLSSSVELLYQDLLPSSILYGMLLSEP